MRNNNINYGDAVAPTNAEILSIWFDLGLFTWNAKSLIENILN